MSIYTSIIVFFSGLVEITNYIFQKCANIKIHISCCNIFWLINLISAVNASESMAADYMADFWFINKA